MIRKIRTYFNKLYKDTKGGTITILLLFLLPILLFTFISRIEQTRVLRATNVTLENAVEESARYGAMMIDPGSQAIGEPLIAYNRAIPVIEEHLKTFLLLDDNFNGVSGSSFESIEYQCIIYNGIDGIEGYKYEDYFNNYYEDNQVAYMVKLSSNEKPTIIENTIYGHDTFNPLTFFVNDDGIFNEYGVFTEESIDAIKVTMDAPGVLLYVKAKINPVIVNQDEDDYKETVARWAYAKIVKRDDGEDFIDEGEYYGDDEEVGYED